MNNLLYLYKTLLKNINYNDFKPKIDTARKIGNVFVPVSSFTSLLLALNTDFSTMIPMDINILSNITYLFLILSFPEHYTKDIEDIVSIYKDVVKSYTIPALIKKDSADISFLQSIIGNHLITISEYNDKVYYLDPTNNKFLTKDNSSIIINKKFIKFNLNKRRNIKRIMQKEEETYAKNLMEEINTHIICGENIDMFENFYSENKEKYEEVNNKMKKLI